MLDFQKKSLHFERIFRFWVKKEQFFRLRRAKIEKKQLNLILKLDFVAKITPEGGEKKLGRKNFGTKKFYTCEKVKTSLSLTLPWKILSRRFEYRVFGAKIDYFLWVLTVLGQFGVLKWTLEALFGASWCFLYLLTVKKCFLFFEKSIIKTSDPEPECEGKMESCEAPWVVVLRLIVCTTQTLRCRVVEKEILEFRRLQNRNFWNAFWQFLKSFSSPESGFWPFEELKFKFVIHFCTF